MEYRSTRHGGDPLLIQVCPGCYSRWLHRVQHETYGYWLCYSCGWSSMTPQELGAAMAKEIWAKLPLEL